MCVGFALLTNSTSFDVFSDIGCQAGPPVVCSDQLASLKISRVACGFVVMTALKDRVTERIVIRDIYMSFVGEDTGFMLPVGEARAEGGRDRSIHKLESLEYKRIVGRGQLYSFGEGGVDDVDKEGGRKEGYSFIVEVQGGKEVEMAGEGVGASQEFPRDVDKFQVEVGEV